jgi:branched-chain amino acid transport system permease protein
MGYGDMFHMGHAAFYTIGAYTTAIINVQFGIPVLLIMPLAGLFYILEHSRFGRAEISVLP